jgi:hypothetical protein
MQVAGVTIYNTVVSDGYAEVRRRDAHVARFGATMAIELICVHCERVLKVKDSYAGKTGECPYCRGKVQVPQVTVSPFTPPVNPKVTGKREPKLIPPTEKQLDYAQSLGIDIPDGVSRGDLSRMIDERLENAPASESQREFLRELGVKFPENIKANQAKLLLDGALDLRTQIQESIRRENEEYLESLKKDGSLIEHASEDQLLKELQNRGTRFTILFWDDAPNQTGECPVQGRLFWTDELSRKDVIYLLFMVAHEWGKNEAFDLGEYMADTKESLNMVGFSAKMLTLE